VRRSAASFRPTIAWSASSRDNEGLRSPRSGRRRPTGFRGARGASENVKATGHPCPAACACSPGGGSTDHCLVVRLRPPPNPPANQVTGPCQCVGPAGLPLSPTERVSSHRPQPSHYLSLRAGGRTGSPTRRSADQPGHLSSCNFRVQNGKNAGVSRTGPVTLSFPDCGGQGCLSE
jgi:hypothetical protein